MTDLERMGKWLYRRYAPKPDPTLTWERLGGKEKGSWLSDAQCLLGVLEGSDVQRGKPAPSEVGP